MKSLFTVGTCALHMLSITLYSHKNIGFCSSLYGCANRISGLSSWTWIWMGNGKKAFQKRKRSPLQTERLPGTLCRMVFRLLLYQLCSEWKHPSPRDQKQGDETREVRNEWCPNYGLDFLTTKLMLSSWDGACSLRAQTSFTLSLELFPWWEIQPSLLQDPDTT